MYYSNFTELSKPIHKHRNLYNFSTQPKAKKLYFKTKTILSVTSQYLAAEDLYQASSLVGDFLLVADFALAVKKIGLASCLAPRKTLMDF